MMKPFDIESIAHHGCDGEKLDGARCPNIPSVFHHEGSTWDNPCGGVTFYCTECVGETYHLLLLTELWGWLSYYARVDIPLLDTKKCYMCGAVMTAVESALFYCPNHGPAPFIRISRSGNHIAPRADDPKIPASIPLKLTRNV